MTILCTKDYQYWTDFAVVIWTHYSETQTQCIYVQHSRDVIPAAA